MEAKDNLDVPAEKSFISYENTNFWMSVFQAHCTV